MIFCYDLKMEPSQIPGTAAFYDKHIYSRLHETLGLGQDATPSTAIVWAVKLGKIRTNTKLDILDIGCGAGRNLKTILSYFPESQLFAFDGSPLAIKMARSGFPQVKLATGDMYNTWPFQEQFDLVFDITSGIPEARTEQDLETYTEHLYKSLKNGGYAVIEAISPNDGSSRRFGTDKIVHWKHEGDTKPERLMSHLEAEVLFEEYGFEIIASRTIKFTAHAFGETVQREFIQLVIRKP